MFYNNLFMLYNASGERFRIRRDEEKMWLEFLFLLMDDELEYAEDYKE